jgi:sirohydrochlorin cobaltochelatase
MDGYLLFSHGSLLCGAGCALEAHAGRLRARLAGAPVEIGYLNYSDPPFETAVDRLIEVGATRIAIVPYFLVPGFFVSTSLPERLDPVRQRYPSIEFAVADVLGADPVLADALIESALGAGSDRVKWRDVYADAAANCRVRRDCPIHGTARCPLTSGAPPAPVRTPGRAAPLGTTEHPPGEGASALVVMVHGSPKPAANKPVEAVVELTRARNVFPIVEIGFMECNEPTIAQAIDRCIEQGATTIVAVPYFLHLGTHVSDDLPTILDESQSRHPDIAFRMGEYLGLSPLLSDLLAKRARTPLFRST